MLNWVKYFINWKKQDSMVHKRVMMETGQRCEFCIYYTVQKTYMAFFEKKNCIYVLAKIVKVRAIRDYLIVPSH